jgi:hypothetical protein
LIADAVRMEQNNKIAILGFLGAAPNVEINVKRFGGVALAFIFLAGEGDGKSHQLGFEIVDNTKKPVFPRQDFPDPQPTDKNRRTSTICEITTAYPGPGVYTARLYADSNLHYETTFILKQG